MILNRKFFLMLATISISRISSFAFSVKKSSLYATTRNPNTTFFSIKKDFHKRQISFLTSHEDGVSSSVNFSMNPDSEEARLITGRLGISEEAHILLSRHADLIVEWNDRLNLISRKDCNRNVVFGRHILPSLALAAIPEFPSKGKIVDVGTGGGFPGVPLAIAFPESEFLLVDSVGKKLKAIDEMVMELGITNVKTHHGRAEEIVDDPINGRKHKNSFDICVGRSVTSMPKFCFWIQDLLKQKDDEGKLYYIIGGDVEKSVTSRLKGSYELEDLLGCKGASDKRALILNASDVIQVSKESGEKRQSKAKTRSKSTQRRPKTDPNDRSFTKSKGEWSKKDSSMKKQRGYESFKRYEY